MVVKDRVRPPTLTAAVSPRCHPSSGRLTAPVPQRINVALKVVGTKKGSAPRGRLGVFARGTPRAQIERRHTGRPSCAAPATGRRRVAPMTPFLLRGLIAGIVALVAVASLVAFLRPQQATATGLTPLTASVTFRPPLELMGGCAERRLDRGHDVDPSWRIDQENDECLPAQHVRRSADGRPLVGAR